PPAAGRRAGRGAGRQPLLLRWRPGRSGDGHRRRDPRLERPAGTSGRAPPLPALRGVPSPLPGALRVPAGGRDRHPRGAAAARSAADAGHQPHRHGRHPGSGSRPHRGVRFELMTTLAPPAADTTPEPSSRRRRKAPLPLWLLAGALVLPALIPIAYLVWAVVRPGGIDAGGIPAGRLLELFGSTARLMVAVTVTTGVLGAATAWLTTRTDLKGARLWSTLLILPLVIPSYVGALAFLGLSGNEGLLSKLLVAAGLERLPVFSGFWAAWAALSLWNFSYVHLLAVPALRRMDPALEEAARGLGASRWRTFFTVVVPQLRPALLSGVLLVGLYVLSDFGAVSLLRYETFTRAIFTQFRGRLDVTPALFLSGVLVLVALVVVWAEQRARGRAALYAHKPPRRPVMVPL